MDEISDTVPDIRLECVFHAYVYGHIHFYVCCYMRIRHNSFGLQFDRFVLWLIRRNFVGILIQTG